MFLVEGYRDFRRQLEAYRRCAPGRTTDRAQLQPDILFLQAKIGQGVHRPFAPSSTPRSGSSSSLLCRAGRRAILCFLRVLGAESRIPVQESVASNAIEGVKAMMDTVRIRQATLEDLALLLRYRRAMAEEMDGTDEVAVNRMIAALNLYLRAAILEGRWHSWIAEPGGCGSVEIVPWVPGRLDPTPRRAWIHSLYVEPPFRRRGIGRKLTQTIIAWCREQGFEWIYLHASDQGRPLYASLGFVTSSEMRLKL